MSQPTVRRLSASFLSRGLAVALLALAALSGAASSSQAQQVVAIVNGEPITAYDIEQRTKLTQISTQKTPARQDVLQELIDEHLKIQLLKRYAIDGMDQEVNTAFANLANRMRQTPQQLTEMLAKSGVSVNTLKQKIRADITWSQVVRARYQSSLQIADKDILAKLEESKTEDQISYDYTLRPILFVVPRGSPDSLRLARAKEAEALRARFTDCQEGIRLARTLRDVAVKAPVTRNSADLSPALREILDKTEVGRLSAPEPTNQGIEVFAICGKKQASADQTLGKRKIREELFSSQFETYSKRFIKELRSQAMIEYR
jgi:peptidyl-prolyl cis-trans isomerase SurA